MAGDVKTEEALVPFGRALSAFPGAPPPILHDYGPNVRIAKAAPLTRLSDELRAPPKLSFAEKLGLEAFQTRIKSDYREAKLARPDEAASWDLSNRLPPHTRHDQAVVDARSALGPSQKNTSTRLNGKVSVGVVMVSGPGDELTLTNAEQQKIVTEVQNGLAYLGTITSPPIHWTYDIQHVVIASTKDPTATGYEGLERVWRDPALQQIGRKPGMIGVYDYVNALRSKDKSNWGFAAFFTKYPLHHFAYAALGGPRLTMHYQNDGWGPDELDRVFAHEACHIFGAPDEYASSMCDCDGNWGFFGDANLNCERCADKGGVPCIMRNNIWEMCYSTKRHLGLDGIAPPGP